MELVYLWVEKYKNIEKQGFNFSPKFRCEFDAVYKENEELDEEKSKLIIKENPNYVSIFPENINITAIVGKNGSGKSSVLEAIVLVANKYDFLKDKKVLLLVKDNNKFYVVSNIRNIKYYPSNLDLEFNDNILTDMVYFNFNNLFLKRFYERLTDNHLFIHHIVDVYFYYSKEMVSVLSDKFKFNFFKFVIKPAKLDLEKELLLLEDEKDFFREFQNHFIKIVSKLFKIKKNFVITYEFDKLEEILAYNLLIFYIRFISHLLNIENKNLLEYFLHYVDKKIQDFMDIFQIDIFTFIKEFQEVYIEADYKNYLIRLVADYKSEIEYLLKNKQFFQRQIDTIKNMDYFELHLPFKEKDKIKEIIQNTITLTGLKYPEDNYYLMDAFEYDLLEKKENTEIKYSDLSDGEKTILKNVVEILFFYLERGINIFLLDEPDNFLHPQWKKDFVNILVKLSLEISKFDNSFKPHIILTTHSPFIISDLPKENIIFLDKDKNGKCKVVDGLNEKKETFGANIHTLLSDSFFMEDGLMGEFAKSKINEIIDFLNDKKTLNEISIKEKEIIKIIEYIGEPFLKQKLLDMYYKKFEDEALKRERKEKLLAEKRRIEEELKKYD